MLALTFASALSYSQGPSVARTSRASVQMATLAEIKADSGVSGPTGFFDPIGLMANPLQQAKYATFKESEIKHCRVAMLAAPGFLLAEVYHPLFGGEIDVPSIVAFQATPLQGLWPIVVLVIGAIEGYSSVSTFQDPTVALWAIKPGHIAGDLGLFGGANFAKTKPAEFKTMATKELSNGRLAMLAIAGMVVQELVTGTKL